MRIALVCPYSVSVPGGVQNQTLGLARELRRLDHDVTVLAPVDGPVPDGVTTIGRSMSIATNGSMAQVAPDPRAARRTLRILRRGAFDVVHLQEPLSPSITIPVLLAGPGPLVGTFHAAGDQTAYRVLGRVLGRLARRLDTSVAVSETAAAPARRYLGGSYEVLFNGIDASRFGRTDGHRADPPVALFLGRDEPRKGLQVLLDAFELLPPDLLLWVAGPGTDDGHLRRRYGADRRICWLGPISEEEKVARLRAASLLCVPSLRAESFGIVLLEAMAAGTPIVASDLPAYRSVTDHGQAAVLVPPGDPAALADSVQSVLRDGDLVDSQRAAGRVITERYSMRALAERYLAIYERTRSGAADDLAGLPSSALPADTASGSRRVPR